MTDKMLTCLTKCIIEKVVDDVLDHRVSYIDEVQKGIDAADARDFASPEEVNAVFERMRVTNKDK